ncbi:MAG: serpin family protein, partial [Saccharofermentanales bacterium]
IPLDELNNYLYTYVKNLPSEQDSKLSIANSIWFRDDASRLTVEKDFLQKNADFYNASAYKSAFDDQTLTDINNWVKTKTDGLIDKILEEISDDAVMYLINALVFDAKWEKVYSLENVKKGEFTAIDNTKKQVDMMNSEEILYLENENSVGFLKPYKNKKYSFAALLPDTDISINDYIASLTGESFYKLINEPQTALVSASLPKFSYAYTVKMNEPLKEMGITDAFSGTAADFSKLGKSSRGNLFIGEVIHKTFISVDELGTKAGAVTKVEIIDESLPDYKYVILNRPFVYAIIDNATRLPVFIGTVLDVK